MIVTFLSPSPLSGIGQVMLKYATMARKKVIFLQYGQPIGNLVRGDVLFAFVLPVASQVQQVKDLRSRFRKVVCMTVCETQTVHPGYGDMMKELDDCMWVTPSLFCFKIFTTQWPKQRMGLLYHWATGPRILDVTPQRPDEYVFYTIANAHDPRKQVARIVEAFIRCRMPDARLLIKATGSKPYELGNIPNVTVINGLLDPDAMERDVHGVGHCYVNFSCSEGVGMGAVEAALRGKPVIMPEWGGCKEYVNTPYLIPCRQCKVGFDDFLFHRDMEWGSPDFEVLMATMTKVYNLRQVHQDHQHTMDIMAEARSQFKNLVGL